MDVYSVNLRILFCLIFTYKNSFSIAIGKFWAWAAHSPCLTFAINFLCSRLGCFILFGLPLCQAHKLWFNDYSASNCEFRREPWEPETWMLLCLNSLSPWTENSHDTRSLPTQLWGNKITLATWYDSNRKHSGEKEETVRIKACLVAYTTAWKLVQNYEIRTGQRVSHWVKWEERIMSSLVDMFNFQYFWKFRWKKKKLIYFFL